MSYWERQEKLESDKVSKGAGVLMLLSVFYFLVRFLISVVGI